MKERLWVPPSGDTPQEQEAKERTIADAVRHNKRVQAGLPADASVEQIEATLLREGVRSTMFVREPSGELTLQQEMFCLDEDAGGVQLTYVDGDRLGYEFWIPKDRIIKIENE